jgi:hypothetical protein
MKQGHSLTILRWVCVLPAVGLSFVVSIFLALHFNSFIYEELFRFGFVVPTGDGLHFELLWDGPLAAIFFVLSGALVAPKCRRQVALALFGLGAVLTPGLVKDFSFSLYGVSPAVERLDTVCGHWTIASTYIGGALAVVCVFIATRRSVVRSEEIPLDSTTALPPA